MRVVVTRPAEDAARWVEALVRHGLQAQALPLITLAPLEDTTPLRQAWARVQEFQALMFVSAAAVSHFFDQRPPDTVLPRLWAPGPGTAQALRQQGLDAARIVQPAADSAQWDSEALWQAAAPTLQSRAPVLIVRGAQDRGDGAPADARGAGRDWLAQQLQLAGVAVEHVAAYRRGTPVWTATEQEAARALAAPDALWLFSSSQALDHLQRLLPGQDWQGTAALATHPRIAEAARQAGFGVVWPSRPAISEVVASIESIR